jgi:hypothetical protein
VLRHVHDVAFALDILALATLHFVYSIARCSLNEPLRGERLSFILFIYLCTRLPVKRGRRAYVRGAMHCEELALWRCAGR